ncbi:alpha/beta fold hydrolase [Vulgatibacter sp.]|uniref:alpha/beta fold hydrolase n=1 Tax=Vulgatibacter sp. TaxID=1971226 RepID=UPI003568A513
MRRLLRTLGALVLLAAAALLLATTTQAVASARDRAALQQPGRLVEGGGHRLHLLEQGKRSGAPSLVLLHGAGSSSAQWGWLGAMLAERHHVVAVDRAGLGFSEPGESAAAEVAVEELRTALRRAGIAPPWLLVGHSLGGLHARLLEARHPGEVAGLVLLDAPAPAFFERLSPAARESQRSFRARAQWLPALSRLGILRLLDPLEAVAAPLPSAAAAALRAFSVDAGHQLAAAAELAEIDAASASFRALRDVAPPAAPVLRISRGAPDDEFTRVQQALDREATAAVRGATHRVIPGATHFSLVTEAHHARAVAEAITGWLARSLR